MTVEDIRNVFRRANVRYKDTEDIEENDEWESSFWTPIQKYQFDDREGLNTRIILGERNENSSYEFLLMQVGGVYTSTDMSLLNQAYKRINQLNLNWKLVKWICTTGKNLEDVPNWGVHVSVDLSLDGDGKIVDEQFWRSHAGIWHSIMDSWENFSIDLGLASSKQKIETIQEIPENIEEIDKETMRVMFDRFLDEKFDNV